MNGRKYCFIIIVAALLIVAMSGCSVEEEPGISFIDWGNHDLRAEQVVTALLNGDFTRVAEGFDDDMSSAIDVRGLRKAWRDTVRIAGSFYVIDRTEISAHDGYEIYDVVSLHANRNINTRVVFSADDKIAGLFFTFI